MKTLKTLKSWVYPVTPLTIITITSIVIAIQSIYIGLTHESPMILYPIIAVPVTGFIIGLYVLDRFVIKSTPYYIIFAIELLLFAGGYIGFKYMNATTDINISTDNDYIVVFYDAKETSMHHFHNHGLFDKTLHINNNIVHLDPSLCHRNDIRILPPESWMGSYQHQGNWFHQGDSIPYLFLLKNNAPNAYERTQQKAIDSLLHSAIHQ
ncbi:hypothetical protein [Aestuariibaculum suncheonense]|uniref:Uncharacterized protein n=1 Tax=Aestuariibaculum suncheonense TaxID=1028745 RepID=A0A8J6UFN2_9FLAO|nr:hypothetical protein [Aestuariibaculum suncheonense]MBD0834404.1 hypothetical protein [Aestuariibaculum suncheonense]